MYKETVLQRFELPCGDLPSPNSASLWFSTVPNKHQGGWQAFRTAWPTLILLGLGDFDIYRYYEIKVALGLLLPKADYRSLQP
jgi:hypothetical protein